MFAHPKPVIAMIHVGALPGTPAGGASVAELEARAVEECRIYRDAGVHAIGLENMHDVPYLRGGVGPEITAAMAVIALAVKRESGLPCGVQILAGANREALAVGLVLRAARRWDPSAARASVVWGERRARYSQRGH